MTTMTAHCGEVNLPNPATASAWRRRVEPRGRVDGEQEQEGRQQGGGLAKKKKRFDKEEEEV